MEQSRSNGRELLALIEVPAGKDVDVVAEIKMENNKNCKFLFDCNHDKYTFEEQTPMSVLRMIPAAQAL